MKTFWGLFMLWFITVFIGDLKYKVSTILVSDCGLKVVVQVPVSIGVVDERAILNWEKQLIRLSINSQFVSPVMISIKTPIGIQDIAPVNG